MKYEVQTLWPDGRWIQDHTNFHEQARAERYARRRAIHDQSQSRVLTERGEVVVVFDFKRLPNTYDVG